MKSSGPSAVACVLATVVGIALGFGAFALFGVPSYPEVGVNQVSLAESQLNEATLAAERRKVETADALKKVQRIPYADEALCRPVAGHYWQTFDAPERLATLSNRVGDPPKKPMADVPEKLPVKPTEVKAVPREGVVSLTPRGWVMLLDIQRGRDKAEQDETWKNFEKACRADPDLLREAMTELLRQSEFHRLQWEMASMRLLRPRVPSRTFAPR